MTQPPNHNSTIVAIPEEPPEPPPAEGCIIPQHNREAEEAVIGAVLINPEVYDDLAKTLRPEDFYLLRHQWIWQAFTHLNWDQVHLDYLTLIAELERAGHLDEIGGPAYLTALLVQVPTSMHARDYARLVKAQAIRRQLAGIASDMASGAYSQNESPANVIARTIAQLSAIQPDTPRYVVHTAAEALEPRQPIAWIINPLLSQGSVAIFYGEPGTKKTYSALSLAVCVAAGKPWLGMETRPTKVFIIDEESGERRMYHRLGSALRGELLGPDCPIQFISLAGFHLDNPADVLLLEREIKESGAGLVIFDALADLMEGDENSKQDTQPVLNALRRLAEHTGTAILVIHHANKLGGYRGSSAIKGAVDLMVQVTSEDGSPYINFKSEKNRDGEAISWSAKATWINDGDKFYLSYMPQQEKSKPLSKSQEYVLRYLTEHGPSPLPEIMANADVCSDQAARKAVYNLAGQKIIYRTNPGKTGQGVEAIYDLIKSDNE